MSTQLLTIWLKFMIYESGTAHENSVPKITATRSGAGEYTDRATEFWGKLTGPNNQPKERKIPSCIPKLESLLQQLKTSYRHAVKLLKTHMDMYTIFRTLKMIKSLNLVNSRISAYNSQVWQYVGSQGLDSLRPANHSSKTWTQTNKSNKLLITENSSTYVVW